MKQTLLCLSALALLLSTSHLEAASISLTSTKDNTLYESATGGTSNGNGQFLFIGSTNNLDIRRGLLAFDIASSVPAGSTITSVELALALTKSPPLAGGTMHDFNLHRASENWGEGTSDAGASGGQGTAATAGDATWVHTFSPGSSWATPGGDFAASSSGTTTIGTALSTYTWASSAGMIADVQHWLDNPSQDFGWVVRGEESVQKSVRQFGSREHATPDQRPVLNVQYTAAVPEPSGLVLISCGLLALLNYRRGF